MTQLDIDTALDWRGRTVVDRDGEKIGTFEELYLDESDRPAWAGVKTGLFGLRHTFVPLSGAERTGDDLRVPFDRDVVKDAPNVDPDEQLSTEDEDVLFRHYGLRSSGEPEREPDEAPPVAERQEPRGAERATGAQSEGEREGEHDRPAGADRPGEGAEVVRSEEEVSVGTQRRVTGRARLKKHVVTEHVQKTVPVQREEVRVEFEPAEGGADAPPAEQGEPRDPPPEGR